MAPSAMALGAARASLLHAANYRQHGTIMISEPATGDGAQSVPIFYPVSLPDGINSAPLRLIIDVQLSGWRESSTGPGNGNLRVIGPAGVIDTKRYDLGQADEKIDDHALGKFNGPRIRFDVDVPMERVGTADYGMALLLLVGAGRIGRVVAMVAPRQSALIGAQGVWNIAGGNLAPGKRLIGFARGSGSRGSVDALAYHQWSTVANERTALSASRPCLFSWSQPCGRIASARWTTSWMVNSFRPLLSPRMLRGGPKEAFIRLHVCILQTSYANWTLQYRDARTVSYYAVTVAHTGGVSGITQINVNMPVTLPLPDAGIEMQLRIGNTGNATPVTLYGLAMFQGPTPQHN